MEHTEYKNKHFGLYTASSTTEDDVEEILSIIKKEPDEQNAVQLGNEATIAQSIEKGWFIKVSRVASNEDEEKLLGKKEQIVAVMGVYPVTQSPCGEFKSIALETAARKIEYGIPATMGMGQYIGSKDIPNADNELPDGCFGRFLVATAALNALRLAGEKINGKEFNFDTLSCNISQRPGFAPILKMLLDAPLSWKIIGWPSKELRAAQSTIKTSKENAEQYYKLFLELKPSDLPECSEYLLKSWASNRLYSMNTPVKNVVDIDIKFSPEMILFLEDVARSSKTLVEYSSIGYTGLRKHYLIPQGLDAADPRRNPQYLKSLYRSNHPDLNDAMCPK